VRASNGSNTFGKMESWIENSAEAISFEDALMGA